MKRRWFVILVGMLIVWLMAGCSDDNDDVHSGYIEVNVSQVVSEAVNALSAESNEEGISYYLIDVYSVNNTTNSVTATTRIDSPETSAALFGLPVGSMLFVCKGYDKENNFIYQGSAQKDIKTGNNGSLDISVSVAGWHWQDPLPQGNSIRSVWGPAGQAGGASVFAVGDTGTILQYASG